MRDLAWNKPKDRNLGTWGACPGGFLVERETQLEEELEEELEEKLEEKLEENP